MPLADLVGQDAVTAALRRAVDTGQIAHAYLFVGPDAVGKHTAAVALAQALNCRQPRQGDACGQCASCRKVELGVHPDVRVIGPTLRDLTPVPDDAPGSALIRMSQIRVVPDEPKQSPPPLVHDIVLRPSPGPWKVYVISPADRMQSETANALLHVLEEPPPYAVLVLVTARPAAILPTIHSRCREVRFRLAPAAAIARCLQDRGVEADQAQRLARLAAGRTGWAVRAAGSPRMMQARQGLLDWIQGLGQAPPEAALKLAQELRALTLHAWESEAAGDDAPPQETPPPGRAQPATGAGQRLSEDQVLRARLPQSLEVVLTWLRDVAAVGSGRPDLVTNSDQQERLSQMAAVHSLADLRRAMSTAHRAIGYIERNASIPITTDALVEALHSALARPPKG